MRAKILATPLSKLWAVCFSNNGLLAHTWLLDLFFKILYFLAQPMTCLILAKLVLTSWASFWADLQVEAVVANSRFQESLTVAWVVYRHLTPWPSLLEIMMSRLTGVLSHPTWDMHSFLAVLWDVDHECMDLGCHSQGQGFVPLFGSRRELKQAFFTSPKAFSAKAPSLWPSFLWQTATLCLAERTSCFSLLLVSLKGLRPDLGFLPMVSLVSHLAMAQ